MTRGTTSRTPNLTAHAKLNFFLYGHEYIDVVQLLNDEKRLMHKATLDARAPGKKKAIFRDVAVLYGQRPKHDSLWYLSPYELVMYWEPALVSYPLALADADSTISHYLRLDVQNFECKSATVKWRIQSPV